MSDTNAFAHRLKTVRKAADLSIYALSKKAEVDRAYLGKLEKGVGDPSWSVVQKLAAALGCSTEELRAQP